MRDKAFIFDVKRDCSEDGPGVRTTVFFKGCPLSCVWCQNPEGIDRRPTLSFRRAACEPSRCGAPCVDACSAKRALRLVDGSIVLDHGTCDRCDLCFETCSTQALRPVGYEITLEELLYKVLIDKPFFDATEGGVTVSGGEATLQMGFVSRFLMRLREKGVRTALETCGYFDFERFQKLLLPHLDLVYFDLKLFDEEASRRHTGRSNSLILRNFVRLSETAEIPVVPRIPLVPGITDTEENLSSLARFLENHDATSFSLMPYNPLWVDKLQDLGQEPRYHHRGFMSKERERACVEYCHQAAR